MKVDGMVARRSAMLHAVSCRKMLRKYGFADPMRTFTTSMLFICGLALPGCRADFGSDRTADVAPDAAISDDASVSDGFSTDGFPNDESLDADASIDAEVGAGGDERPRDAVPEDIVRDAQRTDGSTIEAGPRDVVEIDETGIDDGRTDVALLDASNDGNGADVRCVPETDQEFCARLGQNCETVSGTDNCSSPRDANCGTCATGLGCVDHVCKTPVCSSFTYSSAVFPPFSLSGSSDFAIATSAAGESIVYAQSPAPDCATAVTYLADEITPGSRTYTPRSIKPWLDANGMTAQALSGDGLTLIVLSTDLKSYQAAHRSALQLLDFGALSTVDFKAINAMLAGTTGMFRGGAISADGLEFCYAISNAGTAIDGLYCSKRLSASSRFSTGARLIGVDASYTDVTGISSDRLTLFVFKAWSGFVLTRSSTSAEFSNPNAPNPPPQLAGWQHKPLADCATLIATSTVTGGCGSEDVVFQARR